MTRHKDQAKAMREVWEVIAHSPRRFIVPAFLAASLVLAGSLLLPRKYQGEAILERRTDMVLTEIASRGASQTFQNPRQSLTEEISGRLAMDELAESLRPRLAQLGVEATSLRGELARRVVVRYDVSSHELDRVRVSCTAENPELARAVVNTLVENYIRRTRAFMDARLRESADFFDREVAHDRALIEELENRRLSFEIKHAELLPENPGNVQVTLADARERLEEADQARKTAALREEALRKQLDATAATTPSVVTSRNPELERLETKGRELQTQLNLYLGTYKMTEKHPDMVDLRLQISELTGQITATPREVVSQRQVAANPKHDDLGVMVSTAAAERRAHEEQCRTLREKVAAMDAESAKLFPVRSDYRKLTRDLEQHQRQLAFWEDNLRRVRMALAAESGNRGVQLSFLKPCDPIEKPSSPALAQVLLAALGLAGVAGVVCVFVAHRADEAFRDGDALSAALRLPLLGSVGELAGAAERRLRRLRRFVLYPVGAAAMAALLLALTGLVYLSLEEPQHYARLTAHPARFLVDRAFSAATGDGGDGSAAAIEFRQTAEPASSAALASPGEDRE